MCLLCYVFFLFFFCKQKTAYEMRISDWSSDVCSSDLPEERTIQPLAGVVCKKAEKRKRRRYENGHEMGRGFRCHMRGVGPWRPVCGADRSAARCAGNRSGEVRVAGGRVCAVVRPALAWPRSEEHTSELQSLMRISYAVFCLNKKQ